MQSAGVIRTKRLELVPGTAERTRAALEGPEALAAALGAGIPAGWPPEYLDPPALQFVLDRLAEHRGWDEWGFYFAILPAGTERTLVGCVGYTGPPTDEGTVEIGYGIVSGYRRQGFAAEAAGALVARAFDQSAIKKVIAHTMPELSGSIGVLRRCGFHLTGAGAEEGSIRYELSREQFAGRAETERA